MEEQKKGNGAMLWTVAVIVIALIAVGGYKYMQVSKQAVVETPVAIVPNTPDTTSNGTSVTGGVTVTTSTYRDGTYSATGHYMSPGGQEAVGVSLVLKGDVVTDATVTVGTTRSESKQYQNKFISGYKTLVVGKKIIDINLTKVSGSSLTPKGFMDAVSQIETQAKA